KGIIAAALAEKSRTVISVEIDPDLASKLRENLRGYGNVLVYEADFLSLPLPQTQYKVFSNIPFNLSADILRKLTDTRYPPVTSYLIVQKEFADKLISKPGGYNSQLSILLGVRFELRIVQRLRPTDFYPRPRVTAVLLEVSPRTDTLLAVEDLELFRDFVVYSYNAYQSSVAIGLKRLFAAAEFKNIAEALQFPANATPAQLNLRQWLGLFVHAAQKRPLLEKLVGGQEKAVARRHSKRTKLHRTRYDHR
ncbi:MAG TPA: rRNA adenine N(6)-methyltransferase family protein, partial [Magnetospirillaceae bacterium]|nr:rRNA adenine N(6)-methyltransferase family protein [Magnetospirillaceae bacterium]